MEFKIPLTFVKNASQNSIDLASILWMDNYTIHKNIKKATDYIKGNKEFEQYCINKYKLNNK